MKRKQIVIAGIIGPLFYFILLTLLGMLWAGYNPISTGMSEIGAVGSPFKDIMNYLGFSLLGLSIILFSIGLRAFFKRGWQITASYILFLLSGVFMFLVGFFPCDAQCIDLTLAGRMHSIVSTIPAILMPLAIILSAHPLSKHFGKRWGHASFYLGIVSMLSGPLMLSGVFDSYSGIIQRAGLGISLLWMAVLSAMVYPARRVWDRKNLYPP